MTMASLMHDRDTCTKYELDQTYRFYKPEIDRLERSAVTVPCMCQEQPASTGRHTAGYRGQKQAVNPPNSGVFHDSCWARQTNENRV